MENSFKKLAIDFGKSLPHKDLPYSKRNWGHGMHSLCSYQGKLKPAIAHHLVARFTEPGWKVFDPLSGSGTIPLEASLQGRVPIANDLNQLAYILSLAKTGEFTWDEVNNERNIIKNIIENNSKSMDVTQYSDWGYNGPVPTYFHPETYKQILAVRQHMKDNIPHNGASALIQACILHMLHGNRPYALSRNSHPITPFAPKGDFEFKEIIPRLDEKLERVRKSLLETKKTNGDSYLNDFNKLTINPVDAVITSPPFTNSTRFYITNWMRNWMCGWEPEEFKTKEKEFMEYRQKKSMDIYSDFFKKCAQWLKPKGRLIMHTGNTKKMNMATEIIARAPSEFKLIHNFDESVAGREKFGIKDQGATTDHQYLFFERM
ncbi:MAG: Uncharacterised protein [Methanobacteriota archaeon]|nr:MAG: Uncharacterised protein [Euryarchaeota archaeon]